MVLKPNAVFVGHPDVGAALTDAWKQFNWLASYSDAISFERALAMEEVSNDIQVIITTDDIARDKHPRAGDFDSMLAQLAPHCFFGIVNYYPSNNERLRERISNLAFTKDLDESKIRYYFLSRDNVSDDLVDALERYKTESSNKRVVAILNGESYVDENEDGSADFEPIGGELKTLGQVVAVTSSKGGSGKSIIALSLAAYLSYASRGSVEEGLEQEPLKVCVVDMDVTSNHLAFAMGMSDRKNITEFYRVQNFGDDVMKEVANYSDDIGADLFLSPRRAYMAADMDTQFYGALVDALRARYDYVILDTAAEHTSELNQDIVFEKADNIIFVSDLVRTSVEGLHRWIVDMTAEKGHRGGLGVPQEKIAVIYNKYMENVGMTAEVLKRAARGAPIIAAFPEKTRKVTMAINLAKPATLLSDPHWRASTRTAVKSIVNNKYILSDNLPGVKTKQEEEEPVSI